MASRLSILVGTSLLVAACAGETAPSGNTGTDSTVTSHALTTLAEISSTTTVATTSPTSSSTTSPTPTTTPLSTTTTPPVTDLEAGLFCRDLSALGYDYPAAIEYWIA